jgi:hypothetical protein
MRKIIIHEEEIEPKEGIYLVDPKWIHLDEREVCEAIQNNQKIFKVNFGG